MKNTFCHKWIQRLKVEDLQRGEAHQQPSFCFDREHVFTKTSKINHIIHLCRLRFESHSRPSRHADYIFSPYFVYNVGFRNVMFLSIRAQYPLIVACLDFLFVFIQYIQITDVGCAWLPCQPFILSWSI